MTSAASLIPVNQGRTVRYGPLRGHQKRISTTTAMSAAISNTASSNLPPMDQVSVGPPSPRRRFDGVPVGVHPPMEARLGARTPLRPR